MVKTESLQVRCTPDEALALALVANHDRRKKCEALREIIREAAMARGLWPPGRGQDEGYKPRATAPVVPD